MTIWISSFTRRWLGSENFFPELDAALRDTDSRRLRQRISRDFVPLLTAASREPKDRC